MAPIAGASGVQGPLVPEVPRLLTVEVRRRLVQVLLGSRRLDSLSLRSVLREGSLGLRLASVHAGEATFRGTTRLATLQSCLPLIPEQIDTVRL